MRPSLALNPSTCFARRNLLCGEYGTNNRCICRLRQDVAAFAVNIAAFVDKGRDARDRPIGFFSPLVFPE